MDKQRLILIHGKKRVGKDYLAKLIKKKADKETSIISLSEPIKNIVKNYLGITLKELDYYKNNNQNLKNIYKDKITIDITMREILQKYSDNIKNIYGGGIWFFNSLLTLANNSSDIIIIPDVRYMYELEGLENYAKENNLILRKIKIYSDNEVIETHESEKGLDNQHFDIIINNTFKNLDKQIEHLEHNILVSTS